MIPEYAIKEWNKTVPWHRNEQIEQDLIRYVCEEKNPE